ncbi:hypothetical protein Sjap_020517 [Stephania japonica]|uniref:Uncharacterized protein n=1 Tax=Stephania japonica TaxID=461633 RepID=A0AAP0F653_9MAGN
MAECRPQYKQREGQARGFLLIDQLFPTHLKNGGGGGGINQGKGGGLTATAAAVAVGGREPHPGQPPKAPVAVGAGGRMGEGAIRGELKLPSTAPTRGSTGFPLVWSTKPVDRSTRPIDWSTGQLDQLTSQPN